MPNDDPKNLMRIIRCWDCKTIIWPWQRRGIDEQSHRACHRQRCRNIIHEMPDLEREIRREINAIETFYANF